MRYIKQAETLNHYWIFLNGDGLDLWSRPIQVSEQ
jgi:hypothetical protein